MEECYIVLPHVKTYWHVESNDKGLRKFFEMQYGKYVTKECPAAAQYQNLAVLHQADGFFRVTKENGFDKLIKAEKFPGFWGKLFLQNMSEKGYCYLHGGAVEIDNKVFLFIGKSFSGKSTMITYLTAKGAEYVTDDRLVLNAEKGIITPLTRRINLREGTKELFENQYNLTLDVEYYAFHEYKRWRYLPPRIAQDDKKVTCAFLIERKDSSSLKSEKCSEVEAMNIYMENSLSLTDLRNVSVFAQLARTVKLYRLRYSSIEEVRKFLMEADFI